MKRKEEIMDFHFSAKFKNKEMTYHGIVKAINLTTAKIESYQQKIIAICKKELIKKCEGWKIDPKTVISFDIYYFKIDNENNLIEKNVYKWRKTEKVK